MRKRRGITLAEWQVYLAMTFVFLVTAILLHLKRVAVGYEISEKEQKCRDLSAVYQDAAARLQTLSSLTSLREQMRKYHVELTSPREWPYRVLEIPEDR